MTAPTVSEYLKFVNLQMAAEALYGFVAAPTIQNPNPVLTPEDKYSGAILSSVLTDGNLHASKFTATQAADFVSQWEVKKGARLD